MKSREINQEKMARRGRFSRMGAMLLCLALLAGLPAGAAAEQADSATAMLESLRGKTYLTYGSAGDCIAYSFCLDGRTFVYTSAGFDDYFYIHQKAGTIDSATATHEHVLALHLSNLTVIENAALDYDGHRLDGADEYGYYSDITEKTLLIALPGADAGELDGREYSMTVEQHYAGIDDDALFDNYPYDSSKIYIADLSYDGNGFTTPFNPQDEAREGWYTTYWIDEDPLNYTLGTPEENPMPVQVIEGEENPMPVQVIAPEENPMPVQVIEGEDAVASDDALAVDYAMACADYARVLRYNEAEISAYWQDGRRFSYDRGTPECRPIALADITHDGIPELIFIRYDARFDISWLHVFTHGDGVTKQLYYTDWERSGGDVSCLYQHPMNGDLCAMLEGEREVYCHWAYIDGRLLEERLCRYEDGNGLHLTDTSPGPDGYPVEQDIDSESFDQYVQVFTQTPEEVLIYSAVGVDGAAQLDGRAAYGFTGLPCASMRFDEALALLERDGAFAAVVPEDAAGQALPAGVFGRTLTHFSYKNAGTTLTLQADGTFEIYSYDEDSYQPYSGRIDSVRRVSPHGYALHIAEAGDGAEGDWELDDIAPGKTVVLLLPYADEGEITGTLCPTFDQDYNGEETRYVPDEFYIGVTGDSGDMLFKPF